MRGFRERKRRGGRRTRKLAAVAMEKAAQSPVCGQYFSLMDISGNVDAGPQHWPVVARY